MKKLDVITKIRIYTINECSEEKKRLIKKAKIAAESAYAPYSGFNVGAALLLADGNIITGNNQENAAYPSGLCAERTAIFYANAQFPDQPITAIAIIAYNKNGFTEDVCSPCGSCRQVLVEVENRYNKPVQIIMCGKNDIYEVDSVKDLLPLSFGSQSLE